MKNNFVVIGGGTAGFISALFIKCKYPEYNVTLIKDDKIGILGAGEGTTPHMVDFLENELNISIFQLFKNTNTTLKTGIKFTNWTKDKGSYFHGFHIHEPAAFLVNGDFFKNVVREGKNYDDYSIPYQLANCCKSPFVENNSFVSLSRDEINQHNINVFKSLTRNSVSFAVHFDAGELAAYLEKVAVERGIKVINDKVLEVNLDDKKYISSLDLESNGKYEVDYIIDSTGFARLINGKTYNSEWISLSENLPMKEAQPFFLPVQDLEEVNPWTESIAQDDGWIWKIPLQHRYGCGYVYDSDYVDNDTVRARIKQMYPDAMIGEKTFKFKAGYFNKTAINNSFAAGLSSSFVEPLEATSLYLCIDQLMYAYRNGLFQSFISSDNSEQDINLQQMICNRVNEYCRESNQDTAEFIQFHYISDRDDTKFWKEFRQKNILFDRTMAKVHMLNNGITDTHQVSCFPLIFGQPSYCQVGVGLNMLKVSHDVSPLNSYHLDNIKISIDEFVKKHLTHSEVINSAEWKYPSS